MSGRPIRSLLSSLALLSVVAGALVWSIFGLSPAQDLAGGALILYVALEFSATSRGGRRMLMAGAAAALAAAAVLPDPVAVLRHGMASASFIIGLFTALGMLRDSAQSSHLIRRCGEEMVHQPPGRRYAALCLGSHLISVVLNFGVLPLMGIMIMKGNTIEAAGGDTATVAIRKRRMMTAIVRGFAMMTVWSPLAVSFTVIQQVVPNMAWWHLLPLQGLLSVILMGWGWGLDHLDFPPHRRRSLAAVPRVTELRPILGLTLLVSAMVAGAVAAAVLLGTRIVVGAMIVVPPAAVLWLFAQSQGAFPARVMLTARLFSRRLGDSLPGFRSEVAILGGAMFLGSVIAAFLTPEETARAIAALPVPPIAVSILMAWGVMLAAHFGISQLVTVTLLGNALAGLTTTGIHPLVVASGMLGAWGLSICTTTVGAAVMSVARIAEEPISVVSGQWNRRFVLVGAVLLAVWMVVLSLVL